MIESDKIKLFWDARGDKFQKVPFESIANLEEDPDLLQLKIQLETEKIFSNLKLNKKLRILDLGCGVGQWTFRFSPFVQEVIGVDYANSLIQIAQNHAQKENIKNVTFYTSPAELFTSETPFDIIFISGLFVYMLPSQAEKIVKNLTAHLTSTGKIFLRDGTSILKNAYQLENIYSEILKANYSAIYRTRKEYIDLFSKANLDCIHDEQFFYEGCPLNKFEQTRLWFYIFQKKGTTHA